MSGDATITADLMARLKRHYIKPGQAFAGGVFVPECGLNGVTSRRCDALYVGFTSTSGRLLIGHEVKASRADWLHELDQIHKADVWADQCHEWWLVTAPGIVREGELPAGWGLMEPGKSRTRMAVKVKAARHADRQPSWLIVRSIMARLDTLTVQRIAKDTQAERDRLRAEHDERVRRLRQDRMQQSDPETVRKAEVLDHLCERLGVAVENWQADSYISRDVFARALSIAAASERVTEGYQSLAARGDDLRRAAGLLDQIVSDLRSLTEPERVAS